MSSRSRLTAVAALSASALLGSSSVVMAQTYVVRPGDTLADIALSHGTSVGALANENGLEGMGSLAVGQLLRIPDGQLSLPTYARGHDEPDVYAVRPGDSVFSIARAHGVDPTALARVNSIRVNMPVHVGSTIEVPGRLVRVNALISHVADEVGVLGSLVRAVAWHESGWNQSAISPTGAVGLMQIEPSTGEWVTTKLSDKPLDIHRAYDNVTTGALLLKHLLALHDGNIVAALAGYYQGDASVATHGLYSDTLAYQRGVTALIAED